MTFSVGSVFITNYYTDNFFVLKDGWLDKCIRVIFTLSALVNVFKENSVASKFVATFNFCDPKTHAYFSECLIVF